ncbi:MAG: hypothetical protein M1416_01715, partial [Candidatus Pacearchaeota archaeon]|nr:hypothetical protein [Candidatus Pacearchaeota archaeon]
KGAKKYYLKCDISEGMFSNEKVVGFTNVDGNSVSGFFPNEIIKGDKLEVIILESGEKKSLIQPKICGRDYEFWGPHPRQVYVNNNLLSCE